jgi:hypothetical protein
VSCSEGCKRLHPSGHYRRPERRPGPTPRRFVPALHLLAPHFSPLWDRAVAKAYGLSLRERGRNAERYRRFVEIAKGQYGALPGELAVGQNLLEALDEYNYCKYTKHWT